LVETGNKPRDSRIFYGWWIVASGFVIQLLTAGMVLQTFGVYFVHFQEQFGWSRTQISAAFSIQQLETGIFGPIQGWLFIKFGPKKIVTVGVVIAGLGLMMLSRIENLWQFYVAFTAVAIGVSLGGFMAMIATIANWFEKKRSRAMGIAMSGMAVGGLLVPMMAWLMDSYGWRSTAFGSGVVLILVSVPLAQLMRRSPEDHGLVPDGEVVDSSDEQAPSDRTGPDVNFTAMEALRTRQFWYVSFGHASALVVVSALMVHLVPFIVERLEYSTATAGTVVTLMTAAMMVCQIGGGAMGDRVNKRYALMVCLFGHAIALFGMAFSTNIWLVALFAMLHGASWGARVPIVISIRADYFGRKYYATIMGFSSMIMTMGMMTGALFTGFVTDRTNDYTLAFAILATVSALGSILFFVSRPPPLPERLLRANRLRADQRQA
jgi:MFS family permease|tara:strand:+ start:301 stop:1605 length:1305 start_codon:yes stop_codon:yes gene_type:complete